MCTNPNKKYYLTENYCFESIPKLMHYHQHNLAFWKYVRMFLVLFLESCQSRQADFVRNPTGEVVLGRQVCDLTGVSSTPGDQPHCRASAGTDPIVVCSTQTAAGSAQGTQEEAPGSHGTSTAHHHLTKCLG